YCKTGTRCGDRVLRKEWKDDEAVDVCFLDLIDRFVQERMPRAHADKRLHTPASRIEFVCQSTRLLFCEPAERRSASNLTVVTLRSFSPQRRDRVCDGFSQW